MISIAMATYNGSTFIQQQINSILSQSYSDFELIICDDCSTDNTWNLLNEFASEDSRIHCYQNEKNLGCKKNFEKVISLCSRQYIALADQDDEWTPNHLEYLFNEIEDYQIICGCASIIDENNNLTTKTLNDLNFVDFIPNQSIEKAYRIFFNSNIYQGASMLIQRDFLKYALPIPEDVKFHDAWFAALASCFNEKGLKSIHKIITKHRRHSTNTSKPLSWEKKFSFYYRRCPKLVDRITMAENIKKRLPHLPQKTKLLLNNIFTYYQRRQNKFGRIINFFFRLRHYKLIYTTKNKLYFEL